MVIISGRRPLSGKDYGAFSFILAGHAPVALADIPAYVPGGTLLRNSNPLEERDENPSSILMYISA
jgi:hypothetical protein